MLVLATVQSIIAVACILFGLLVLLGIGITGPYRVVRSAEYC